MIHRPLLTLLLLTAPASAQPTFHSLGVLPGGQYSQPFRISSDGSTIVGISPLNLGTVEAFSWRAGSGMSLLPSPAGYTHPAALTTNASGSVIAGNAEISANPNYRKAMRWVNGIPEILPDPEPITPSEVRALSDDGNILTGARGSTAFRWTTAGGFQDLGSLPGQTQSRGFGISADGGTIVGEANLNAFRWTAATGMAQLPPGAPYATAYAISGNGQVSVGTSGDRAARWIGTNSPERLGFPGSTYAEAYGVDFDGDSIVGTGQLAGGASVAFLWTPTSGMLDLNTYLSGLGVDLTGWNLYEARSISADGLTITGAGMHTIPGVGVRQEAWAVALPGPGPATLFLFAAVVITRRCAAGGINILS